MMLYSVGSKYAKIFEDYASKRKAFNEKLMKQGVKAFRPNDGWVKRGRLCVIFFDTRLFGKDPLRTMYYHPNAPLRVGDLIFIGDCLYGGRYARIEKVWMRSDSFVYEYSPLYDYVDGIDYKYITRKNYPRKDTPLWERIKYRLGLYEPEFMTDIYE